MWPNSWAGQKRCEEKKQERMTARDNEGTIRENGRRKQWHTARSENDE